MLKSSMPNIPGMAAMTETFDFVKNLWGGMGNRGMTIPGMVMPTLSAEEVDKQIKDLKAVESWLTVNMNMLRGTIQALEVQSATISTLRTMGENFSAAVAPEKTAKAAAPVSRPAPKVEEDEDDEDEAESQRLEAAAARRKSRDALKAEFKAEAEAAKVEEFSKAGLKPTADPAQWWNQLQEQFKQAVSTAMAPDAMVAAAKAAMPSVAPASAKKAAKPVAKPAAKSVRKTAAKPVAKKAKR
jgi:hypothetical protein